VRGNRLRCGARARRLKARPTCRLDRPIGPATGTTNAARGHAVVVFGSGWSSAPPTSRGSRNERRQVLTPAPRCYSDGFRPIRQPILCATVRHAPPRTDGRHRATASLLPRCQLLSGSVWCWPGGFLIHRHPPVEDTRCRSAVPYRLTSARTDGWPSRARRRVTGHRARNCTGRKTAFARGGTAAEYPRHVRGAAHDGRRYGCQ